MKAEILCIGSELVLGEILNTNSAWLARRLAEIGIETIHHSTVGDDMAHMVPTLAHAVGRAEVVIVTGGIGPTPDDITRDAVAEVAGVGSCATRRCSSTSAGYFAAGGARCRRRTRSRRTSPRARS